MLPVPIFWIAACNITIAKSMARLGVVIRFTDLVSLEYITGPNSHFETKARQGELARLGIKLTRGPLNSHPLLANENLGSKLQP